MTTMRGIRTELPFAVTPAKYQLGFQLNVVGNIAYNVNSMRHIDYGAFVRLTRLQRGQTQEELARELEVTVGTINGWENGRHRPVRAQRTRLRRIAEELGITAPAASTAGAPLDSAEPDRESPNVRAADVPVPHQKVEPIE